MSFKDMVRALALGQSDSANAAYRALGDADKSKYQVYLTAAFAIMLGVRFENDSSRDEIDRFVNEVKSGYSAIGDQLKPLAIEATIRATLGEEDLIEEVSTGDQLIAQMLCVRLITATVPAVHDNLDAYLTDAETLASELG